MNESASTLLATLSTALVVCACQNTGGAPKIGSGNATDTASTTSSSSTAVSRFGPDFDEPEPDTPSRRGDHRPFLIADRKNHRIVGLEGMNGAGEIDLVLANNGEPQGFFENWSVDQRVYITDGSNNLIIRSDDLDGTNLVRFGSTGSGPGHFRDPRGIVVDALNRIYVVDSGNDRIVRIDDMTGKNWVGLALRPGRGLRNLDGFSAPNAIALDRDGRIYIADSGNNRIVRVDDMSGSNWTVLFDKHDGSDHLQNPMGVYVTYDGEILIADTDHNRIVQVSDMCGCGWTTLGSKGDGTDQFNAPHGINDFGLICIADTQNNRLVQIEDITGAGWRTYGVEGRGGGLLDEPWDVWDP